MLSMRQKSQCAGGGGKPCRDLYPEGGSHCSFGLFVSTCCLGHSRSTSTPSPSLGPRGISAPRASARHTGPGRSPFAQSREGGGGGLMLSRGINRSPSFPHTQIVIPATSSLGCESLLHFSSVSFQPAFCDAALLPCICGSGTGNCSSSQKDCTLPWVVGSNHPVVQFHRRPYWTPPPTHPFSCPLPTAYRSSSGLQSSIAALHQTQASSRETWSRWESALHHWATQSAGNSCDQCMAQWAPPQPDHVCDGASGQVSFITGRWGS